MPSPYFSGRGGTPIDPTIIAGMFKPGENLARGLEAAGKNIGDFLERRREENKRLLDTDKALTGLRKANPEAFSSLDPEDLSLMSPRDRVNLTLGVFQGHAMKAADARQTAEMENMARDNTRADQQFNLNAQVAADHSRGTAADAELLMRFAGKARQNPNTLGAFLDAAGETPGSPMAAKTLEYILGHAAAAKADEGAGWEPQVVTRKDENGKTVRFGVTGPKQAVVLPNDQADADAKLRYGAQLRTQKRNLLAVLGDPTKTAGNPDIAQQIRDEIGSIDAELTGLGMHTMAPSGPPAPPAPAPGAGTAQPTARVKVISPDGKVGTIPSDQLDAAMKKGYRRAQ